MPSINSVKKMVTYVEELLVGLILAVGVTDSRHEVVLLVEHVIPDTAHVGELHVSVHVDLNDAVADGIEVLLLAGTGATVEDEEDRLGVLRLDGSLDMGLVLAEELGVKLDVTGLVDTVNVAEAGGDGEVGRDRGEGVVDIEDVLRLGVERVVINILVVDTILLATSDADLHLEPLLHRGSALEILSGGLNVPLNVFLREIDHVRGEKRLAGSLEVSLVGVEHAVEPRKELLGAVVSVEDDGNAVSRSDLADEMSTGNGASDRGGLVGVAYALGVYKKLVLSSCKHGGLPCQRIKRRHPGTSEG
jgi:hypothetical protein